MLYKRLIGVILMRNGTAMQSFGFARFLPIGRPSIVAEYLNRWGADEIMLLDIGAEAKTDGPNLDIIAEIAQQCFIPLTYGGGITSVEHVRALLRCGVDKVSLTTSAYECPELIQKIGSRFGAQCVVTGMDVRRNNTGQFETMIRGKNSGIDPVTLARSFQNAGSGEIMIHSMDRDGMCNGMETELFAKITAEITIPLIGVGGVGKPDHAVTAFEQGCSAIGVGNAFNHSEHSVVIFKKIMRKNGIRLRTGTTFDYQGIPSGADGRILKRDEDYLDDLGFVKVEREEI